MSRTDPRRWLALAVRAQRHGSQARQHQLVQARANAEAAGQAAQAAAAEVADVVGAWQHFRASAGTGSGLEESYRQFFLHLQGLQHLADLKHLQTNQITDDALNGLRNSFARYEALQALERRGAQRAEVERQRADGLLASDAWATRRPPPDEGSA